MLLTGLIFLAILGFLVFIHELGHFLVAKYHGVKVEEFAFGFRPRLFAWKRGETTYAINAIPLGGYVKMYGEHAEETGDRSFKHKNIFQRFQILIAGIIMNFLFGWLIFTVLFAVGFIPMYPGVADNPFVQSTQKVHFTTIVADSPAEQAGLKSGDEVVAVNGQTIAVDQEFLSVVRQNQGKEIILSYRRDGVEQVAKLLARSNPPAGQGPLGVGVESAGKVRSSVIAAPAAGFYESGKLVGLSAAGFGRFVGEFVTERHVSDEVTGLIGVGKLTGATRQLGIDYLAQLIALVTIGLATINLMPIIPLDGGHLAALLYEKSVGRPLSERQLGALATIGLAFVLLVFVAVTYKDVVRYNIFGGLF